MVEPRPNDESTEIFPNDASLRRWKGDKTYLAAAIALVSLLIANLIVAWILQFYFHDSIIRIVSFQGHDPSFVPKGTRFSPALGVHYFGDLEQYVGYARSSQSPYYGQPLPAAYGPAFIVLLKVTDALFHWPAEVFIFLIASVALLFVAFVLITGKRLEAVLVATILLASGGILDALDRGNAQLLFAGLSGLTCVGILSGRRSKLTVVSLVGAIAIKPYAAVFLLVLLKNRKWREAAWMAGLSASVYAVSFLILPGSFTRNIDSFVHIDLGFSALSNIFYIGSAVSVMAVIWRLLVLAQGVHAASITYGHLAGFLTQVPGIFVLETGVLIIWFSQAMVELELIAALQIQMLAPIGSGPYLEINIALELCLILRLIRRLFIEQGSVPNLLLASAGLLVLGAAPWSFFLGHRSHLVPVWELVGPIANFLALIFIIVAVGRARRPQWARASENETIRPAVFAAGNDVALDLN